MPIDVDLSIGISSKGVKFEVKKVDVNNFVIDKIFKKLDRKTKKPKESSKHIVENTRNDCYIIDIKI